MRYRAVIHVDLEEELILNLGLNNISNTLAALEDRDKELILLATGPAVRLLAGDQMYLFMEKLRQIHTAGVRILVCELALKLFDVPADELFEGCEIIPAGVVTLIELQHDGFAYIKP
jgi:intracellular sulfur oxidation DsrE/DsrF family protein